MKKIIFSLAIIAAVAAVVVGGTIAYFSDTETSAGNLFTAGTIDIRINGDNFTWTQGATLDDMKPCYTDYINFTIYNDQSGANPVNVWKKLTITEESTGVVSEPECTSQHGDWDGNNCTWGSDGDNNHISSIINYDLSVEVYNSDKEKIWWQTIYVDGDNKTVADIAAMSDGVYLGMIPAYGYMKVTQSYHMQDPDTPTNWAQGDTMSFNVEVDAIQLRGTAWLENKDTSHDPWLIVHGDGIQGTLEYKVKHPTFDFEFTGKAPLASHNYVLAIGYDGDTNVDTEIGTGATDTDRNITIIGDVELNDDMKNVKVWLVPEENWVSGAINWTGWPGCADNFLWETGLIWYEDTDF